MKVLMQPLLYTVYAVCNYPCCVKCSPEIGSIPSRPPEASSSSVHWNICLYFFFFFFFFSKPNFFNPGALLLPRYSATSVHSSSLAPAPSPLLSHTGITSSDYNNNSNELTYKWQLSSDRSSGLNWFRAAHNGFYSQGPGVPDTTHMLRVHL